MDGQELLPDRLNVEPPVFKGCSTSELGAIAGLASLVWLPASLLVAALFGAVTMGFGVAGIGVVATVVVSAGLFQRIKRNRPDGYYQQRVFMWLGERRLLKTSYVTRTGTWDIGRSFDESLSV